MSTIPLMNNTAVLQENTPYVMSGVIDIYHTHNQSVGIILVHDPSKTGIDILQVVNEYLSFGVQKLYLVNKDGSPLPDSIAYKYPNVISLSFGEEHEVKEKVFSLGYILNIAFEKINTDIVFLSWSHIVPYGMSSCLLNHKMLDFPLCVMPVFEDKEGSILPTTCYPKKSLKRYKVIQQDKNPLYPYSLFPCKGVGIYNRNKFLELGGFDIHITDFFSQLFEFGIRAYSHKMKIRLSPYYRVQLDNALDIKYHNITDQYDLICIKASIGSRLLHSIQFMYKNIKNITASLAVLKIFRDKSYGYKNKIPVVIKEYWKHS